MKTHIAARLLLAFAVCLPIILSGGCASAPDDIAWAMTYNLPALDSSAIRPGRLQNLDDLKGIDNWRLGMPKKYYGNAYPYSTDYSSDTCAARLIVYNFHEDCHAIMAFAGDTLSSVTLNMHCRNVRALIRRLRDLYGEPNVKPFRFEVMEDSILAFPPKAGQEPLEYTEDPRTVFDSVMNYSGPPLPLYRDNTMHVSFFMDRPWPSEPSITSTTNFHFFPHMLIEAAWKSKRSLKLRIFREASVKPYMVEGSETHGIHVDYYARLVMQ